MFYEASQINTLTICKICDQKLDDPRLLPCGKSVCNKCIEIMIDTEKRRIKCHYCAKIHEMPKDGFAMNLELASLVELKPSKVKRSRLFDNLKDITDSIRDKAAKIQTDLLIGEAKIRDECDKVRNDVQIAIEEASLMLDKIHKRFMDEIDDYERVCRHNYMKIKKNEQKFDKVLNKANSFKIKIESMLEKLHLNDEDLEANFDEARSILKTLENTDEKFQLQLYNKVYLNFEINPTTLSESTIGVIKKKQIQLYFANANSGSIKEFDLGRNLGHNGSKPYVYMVHQFGNSKFLLYCKFNQEYFKFYVIDSDGNILAEKELNYSTVNTIIYSQLTPLINDQFFCFATLADTFKGFSWRLQTFNKRLYLISKKFFERTLKFIFYSSECLFLAFLNDHSYTLESYNANLEPLKAYGQDFRDLPYFFPSSIKKILITKKFFVTRESYSLNGCRITVIKQRNGIVKSAFIVEFELNDYWAIYMEKFILLFSFDNKTIFCYDFCGVLKEELEFKLDLSKFRFTLGKELYFLNCEDSVKLYKC
jgi:hypothetical protein